MAVIPSSIGPSGADRPVMYTRAPSRASARATPRPTPNVPPVMTATRSLRDDIREYSEDVVGTVKSSGEPTEKYALRTSNKRSEDQEILVVEMSLDLLVSC